MMLPVVIAIFLAYLILQPATPLGFLAVLALACPIAFVVVKILNYCERFIKTEAHQTQTDTLSSPWGLCVSACLTLQCGIASPPYLSPENRADKPHLEHW